MDQTHWLHVWRGENVIDNKRDLRNIANTGFQEQFWETRSYLTLDKDPGSARIRRSRRIGANTFGIQIGYQV